MFFLDTGGVCRIGQSRGGQGGGGRKGGGTENRGNLETPISPGRVGGEDGSMGKC